MCVSAQDEGFSRWLASLETRHLADFRVAEVTRALRALSSAYVQRRQKLAAGAALSSAGKRAAFALFYGPLHLLTVAHIVRAVGGGSPAPTHIVARACGAAVAAAAWAPCAHKTPTTLGVDRHTWAVDECRRAS